MNKPLSTRGPGQPFGLHRVIEPPGSLPQSARKLDAAGPIFDNEIEISVDTLNIDSASFHQMLEAVQAAGADTDAEIEKGISDIVLKNVATRGKQHNAVTGSGGMLMGTVVAMGPHYSSSAGIKTGDRVATLVSLTLTPLHLDRIDQVHAKGKREAQMDVKGQAFLCGEAPLTTIPSDIPQELVLAALDVCGAPAQVQRYVQKGQTVVVMGTGKSGLLSLFQARENLQKTGCLVAMDASEKSLERVQKLNIADECLKVDAQNPLSVWRVLSEKTNGEGADLVINTANVPSTEMAAILCAKPGGKVYFFNMATQFSRAVLGAEGMGRDVELIMGNGFTPGHAQLTLQMLREHKQLMECFS